MSERVKLGFPLNGRSARLARNIVKMLSARRYDPEMQYFECLLKGEITPSDIQSLLYLPHENSLMGEDDKVFYISGAAYDTGIDIETFERSYNAKFYLHTHQSRGCDSVTVPSVGDVCISGLYSNQTILALAHADGMLIYQRPIYYPDTKESCRDCASENVLFRYYLEKRIDITDAPHQGQVKAFSELAKKEQIRLQWRFLKDTGMIIDKADWNDKRGLERILSRLLSK